MIRIIVDNHLYVFTKGEVVLGLCFDATWVSLVVWWRVRRRKS